MWIALLSFMVWLVSVAITDLRHRKVRNPMVLFGLAMGAAALVAGVQPFGISTANAVLGAVAGLVALMPFYAMHWMGAGDVKFAAVAGLWFGCTPELLAVWVGGSLLAGAHGLAVLAWRRATAHPLFTPDQTSPRRSVPYATCMAVTALVLAVLAWPGRMA
jgi:prepilin peptidase CpaA